MLNLADPQLFLVNSGKGDFSNLAVLEVSTEKSSYGRENLWRKRVEHEIK